MEEQKNMNIYQIGVVVYLACMGFYTLFLTIRTMIELDDYLEENEESDVEKSSTQKALEAVFALSILLVISFCPILNILFCILLFYVENNKDIVFRLYEKMF